MNWTVENEAQLQRFQRVVNIEKKNSLSRPLSFANLIHRCRDAIFFPWPHQTPRWVSLNQRL